MMGPLPPELVLEVLAHLGSEDVGAFAQTSQANCALSVRTLCARYKRTKAPHRSIDVESRQDVLRYHSEVRRINVLLGRPRAAAPPPLECMWTAARDMLKGKGARNPPTQRALRDSLFLFEMGRHRTLPIIARAWETLPLAYLGFDARALQNLRDVPPSCLRERQLMCINIANGAVERDDVRLFAAAHDVEPRIATWLNEAVYRGRRRIAEFCFQQGERLHPADVVSMRSEATKALAATRVPVRAQPEGRRCVSLDERIVSLQLLKQLTADDVRS